MNIRYLSQAFQDGSFSILYASSKIYPSNSHQNVFFAFPEASQYNMEMINLI